MAKVLQQIEAIEEPEPLELFEEAVEEEHRAVVCKSTKIGAKGKRKKQTASKKRGGKKK